MKDQAERKKISASFIKMKNVEMLLEREGGICEGQGRTKKFKSGVGGEIEGWEY